MINSPGIMSPLASRLLNDGLSPNLNNVYSMLLGGVDETIDYGNTAVLNNAVTCTLSCWFKTPDPGQNGGLMYKSTDANNRIDVLLNANKIWFQSYGGVDNGHLEIAFADTGWNHVVLAYDGNYGIGGRTCNAAGCIAMSTYLNGVKQTVFVSQGGRVPINLPNLTGNFIAGDAPDFAGFEFVGNVDEVSLWDHQMGDAEVAEMYNGGKPTNLNAHTDAANLKDWFRDGDKAVWDGFNWVFPNQVGPTNGVSVNMEFADRVMDVPV